MKIKQKTLSVIFDVDGVLVDTVPLHFQAWKEAYAENRIVFGHKEYEIINGIPRDEGVRITLGSAATPQRIKQIGDRKQQFYLMLLELNPPQILPGISALLSDMRRNGWSLAAASSSKNAAHVLAATGLTGCFDAIITGYDFHHPKPHPDIFLTAVEALGAQPAHAFVVEDATNGVRAAVAGGFRCIAVANSESADALSAAGAMTVVSTTGELTLELFL